MASVKVPVAVMSSGSSKARSSSMSSIGKVL